MGLFTVTCLVMCGIPAFAVDDEDSTQANASDTDRRWNFENDIIPVLSRYGCNMSGCHGKAEGQNGFKLSVFGFDPVADYQAIVQEGRGRRVFPSVPENSLLLLKATGQLPHGGGSRIDPARPEYARLRDWIRMGMPFGAPDDPQIVQISVEPKEQRMTMHQVQPLKVTATWSDGRIENVTQLATWQTNSESLASVDENGVVTAGDVPGTVAVMATYLGQVDVFQALIPQPKELPSDAAAQLGADAASGNFIDQLVAERLIRLNVAPSGQCDDATFLRRVYLDVLGTLPTAVEAREFLADASDDNRVRLVDQLLHRPEFADYWTLKWADLLRVNRRTLGRKAAHAYYDWIHDSFARNKPLDQFAAELLTIEGPVSDAPAAYFYKAVPDPNDMANTVSQVFLGVRIECARCHHHPWDRWSQTDYHGMQAFFTQVAFKPVPSGEALTNSGTAPTVHPRTKEVVFAHALSEPEPDAAPVGNRRELLANWLISPGNPWFARNIANRTWAHFLGRGLVEPVDDLRMTNPPSNPKLLDALAGHLCESQFDYRQFVRSIVLSRTYQRSVEPTESNTADDQNYSRFPMKRLDAEVLLDAVSQATGVTEEFDGMPAYTRAIQLWDSHLPHHFLELFGRPVRETACECERVTEPAVAQVLHVLNSPEINDKLRHADGRIARLSRELDNDNQLIDELYLTFFSRLPSQPERAAALHHLTVTVDRFEATEDLAWSMMNSLEFLFNH